MDITDLLFQHSYKQAFHFSVYWLLDNAAYAFFTPIINDYPSGGWFKELVEMVNTHDPSKFDNIEEAVQRPSTAIYNIELLSDWFARSLLITKPSKLFDIYDDNHQLINDRSALHYQIEYLRSFMMTDEKSTNLQILSDFNNDIYGGK